MGIMDKLDNLEEIRQCLNQLSDSKLTVLLDDLPQIVAVGPQSAGKSSVIHKITGVPLPSGSGTCTKIASLILSRRGDQEYVKISLETIDGTSIDNLYTCDSLKDMNIEDQLQLAQEAAFKKSKSKQFISDMIIKI